MKINTNKQLIKLIDNVSPNKNEVITNQKLMTVDNYSPNIK